MIGVLIVGALLSIAVGVKIGFKWGFAEGVRIGKMLEFTRIADKLIGMDDELMATHPHPGPCHRAHPGRKHVGSSERNPIGED